MKKYMKIWNEHGRLREGVIAYVYLDSLGKPTAGIGHLLTAAERKQYDVGDKVSQKQIQKWFDADTRKAERAALDQAAEIGVEADWFIAALISVNFQLGTRWIKDFRTTYPAIVRHDYDTAIRNLNRSEWMRQTPTRVEDFIRALERARDFKARPLKKTRTMTGGAVASVSAVASEVSEQIEPISDYSDTIQLVFVILTLVGVGLMIYARIDDREKGYR